MTTVELRARVHQIIDRIQNEELLQAVHDFLRNRENSKTGELWASLTKEQKAELMVSFDESEDDDNLISNKDIFG